MRFVLAIASLLLAGPVFAGPKCTAEPQNKWLSKEEMIARIKAAHYSISLFKITSGRCYEIYGHDKSGRRVEIYFHPITADPVQSRAL